MHILYHYLCININMHMHMYICIYYICIYISIYLYPYIIQYNLKATTINSNNYQSSAIVIINNYNHKFSIQFIILPKVEIQLL